MTSQSSKDQDSARLSEDAAAMLLARASQLDAANAGAVSIADLRQAARNAGIAPEAFEQALIEFRAASQSSTAVAEPRPKRTWTTRLVLATVLILAAAVFLSRLFVGVSTPVT
jgi:hypothetical protein